MVLQTLVVLLKDKQQVFQFRMLVVHLVSAPKIRCSWKQPLFMVVSKPLWVVDGVIMEDVSNVGADDLALVTLKRLSVRLLQALTLMILRASKSLKTVLLHLYMVLVPWQVLSL